MAATEEIADFALREGAAAAAGRRPVSIEELCFTSAMSCFEGWLKLDPAIGPRTMAYVTRFISRTLEKTHNLKDVRENLSNSVEVWIWLTRDFAAAIPSLTTRSIGPLATLNDPDKGATPQESGTLITKNYPSLKEDLQLLIKLMHVARNLLVVQEPEVPQDLCAAAQFDQMLYQTIILCVNVTSKAYDGDILEEAARMKLGEITELYKKLLVTCLQQAHNWTAKNDRNKMSFWSTVLFDETDDYVDPSNGDFRPDIAHRQIQAWYERHSELCPKARQLLREHEDTIAEKGLPPGHLPSNTPLAWNWLPEGSARPPNTEPENAQDSHNVFLKWIPDDDPDKKIKQAKVLGRVSEEIDKWWLNNRDPNFICWEVPMPNVEFAKQRTETCTGNLFNRCPLTNTIRNRSPVKPGDEVEEQYEEQVEPSVTSAEAGSVAEGEGQEGDDGQYVHDYNDDMIEEEDIDEDEYNDGPMTGLLTEVPNILDPKQIEALHMIVKSCIYNTNPSGAFEWDENLQKTRCRMLLATECGKSLLREILVFIAVWEKSEQSLIFQLTTQIVEAIHHCALIPYAWQSLRIPKDIISPAQTVLLRLVNGVFRTRVSDAADADSKHDDLDNKLLHFLFIQFRSRIVPECAALMQFQASIRDNLVEAADFPVDSWDMERAKDGLQQFLELLATVNDLPEMRQYLIQWEATYELLLLLKELERGVPKKPMVEPPARSAHRQPPHPSDDHDHGYDSEDHPLAPPPPTQEPAHKFPWAGIKGQILHILAGLLQPPLGRSSPGNPIVQKQILRHNGLVSLLNCCVYDDHNRFARERVQICLKWLMDGSEDANKFLRNLVAKNPPPNPNGGAPSSSATGAVQNGKPGPSEPVRLRIDGIPGEVPVRVRNPNEPAPARPVLNAASNPLQRTLPAIQQRGDMAAALAAAVHDELGDDGDHETINTLLERTRNMLPPIRSQQPPQASESGGVGEGATPRHRSEALLRDIINLADEAARLAALTRPPDADETEEEEEEEEEEEGRSLSEVLKRAYIQGEDGA
ncbi:hypothetical protein QBC35DRAFT_488590 [Podospora australis]|uniref:Ataxin-10 homolog n=1 Tax=Podospora australis TaxID=1536484 RepID=A0AAN7AJG0_9PEZI|nr:hypothetical protein QBC35DRAFT_488590 [Podospora australis]